MNDEVFSNIIEIGNFFRVMKIFFLLLLLYAYYGDTIGS